MKEPKIWNIRKEDKPLIEAAIRLGDYLKKQNQINKEQNNIIQQVQDILRCLPNYKKGFKAGYQLMITNTSELTEEGKKIYWAVEIFDDVIEIFSNYDTIPELKDKFKDMINELDFFLVAGRINKNDTNNYLQWINETSNPESFLCDGYHLIIEISFGNTIIRNKKNNYYS